MKSLHELYDWRTAAVVGKQALFYLIESFVGPRRLPILHIVSRRAWRHGHVGQGGLQPRAVVSYRW